MPTTEEAYEWLKDNAPEEIAQALETAAIREENKRLAGVVKELEPQVGELKTLKRTPLIEQALKDAKVDVTKVAPGVMESIVGKLGDSEPSGEWASEMATHFGLPIDTSAPDASQQQEPAAAGFVTQATSAQGTTDANSAFYAELEAAEPGEPTRAVLAKYGKLAT